MKTVLIEGGSTAYGLFDHERGGWAERLKAESMPYNAAHPLNPILIKQHAVMGRTIASVLRDYGSHALPYRRTGSLGAVLSVGLNESKILPSFDRRPAVSLEKFTEQLQLYGEMTDELETPVVYVGPQPVDEAKSNAQYAGFNLEDDLVEEFGEAIRLQAVATNMPYVNTRELFLAQGLDRVLANDGRHPNPLGHAILHEAVRDALLSIDVLPWGYNDYRT